MNDGNTMVSRICTARVRVYHTWNLLLTAALVRVLRCLRYSLRVLARFAMQALRHPASTSVHLRQIRLVPEQKKASSTSIDNDDRV